MFESAELGHSISRKSFERKVPSLRANLLDAQYDLSQVANFPVIILIGGVDGAGKGETVAVLNEWMDPRHIYTHAFGEPSDEERDRPPNWRFWRVLPPKGKIGILYGSWYSEPILRRVYGKTNDDRLDQSIEKIIRLERMLTDEGALILKFWFHLSKARQKERLRFLEKNPKTRWRVTATDWERFKLYDKFRRISEHTLRQTSTAAAPWVVVEGADHCYRSLTVGNIILETMRKRLDQPRRQRRVDAPPMVPPIDNLKLLRTLNLKQKLSKQKYESELETYQGKLNLLARQDKFKKMSAIILFEGVDAGGKGGAIRRVSSALDARYTQIVPIAAPSDEERAQPYLWRFWRHIPRRGRVTIFDRSWYGRVLVERVEGYCAAADWMRAYTEINDFEAELIDHRAVVIKFWLAIDKDEQLRRFKEREKTHFKRFKITAEDWRNREKWDDYESAVCDMVDRTSTEIAPWTLVEANDKYYARIKILKTLCREIENALEK
jgi:AMP-polyphosphate phosphotransferase